MTPSQPVAGNQLSRTSAAEPLTVAKRSTANPPRPSAVINTTPNALITLFRMDMFEKDSIGGSALEKVDVIETCIGRKSLDTAAN